MQTTYPGIDYGLGRTNIGASGIRFGVIPAEDIGQAWYDDAEPDYGEPTCPECGGKVVSSDSVRGKLNRERDYVCGHCRKGYWSDVCFADSPHCFTYQADGYRAQQGGDDCDVFILESPFFTYAQFCSPCAPGACYLRSPLAEPNDSNRAYCFGHDWFEDGKAPYPVYSVETGELVSPVS